MPLQSPLLSGNTRLDAAAAGGPSIKPLPAVEDAAAVQKIQQALVALGHPLPNSFKSGGPDGRYGQETAAAVLAFQKRVFPGDRREWDGRVGKKTLEQMDAQLLRGTTPPKGGEFICGPDVTAQVATAWKTVQTDFRGRTRAQKIQLCNRILIPVKDPVGLVSEVVSSGETDLKKLLAKVRTHADIDGWDMLPLYQGASAWLRTPPVYDDKTKGPCATPSSSDFGNADPFADGHEDEATCSNTVQVGNACWLNGSVNYGTFGIMVKECSEFAANDLSLPRWSTNPFDQPLKLNPLIRSIYSLTWATMLIRAYKKFGGHPEGAIVPVAWTEATFNGGPSGKPGIAGNRPKCKCNCGCKGDIVNWDYVWEPLKPRSAAKGP